MVSVSVAFLVCPALFELVPSHRRPPFAGAERAVETMSTPGAPPETPPRTPPPSMPTPPPAGESPAAAHPQDAGPAILTVTVISAQGLRAADRRLLGFNSSDPFVRIRCADIDGTVLSQETTVVPRTLNPQWRQRWVLGTGRSRCLNLYPDLSTHPTSFTSTTLPYHRYPKHPSLRTQYQRQPSRTRLSATPPHLRL